MQIEEQKFVFVRLLYIHRALKVCDSCRPGRRAHQSVGTNCALCTRKMVSRTLQPANSKGLDLIPMKQKLQACQAAGHFREVWHIYKNNASLHKMSESTAGKTSTDVKPWLATGRRKEAVRVRLFCFPQAGAGSRRSIGTVLVLKY